ncbi:14155_t:CDS:2 [Entrophospora sp. SA101]|nr:14155_t:CDS:2 [Entrophospora sp. SA101]
MVEEQRAHFDDDGLIEDSKDEAVVESEFVVFQEVNVVHVKIEFVFQVKTEIVTEIKIQEDYCLKEIDNVEEKNLSYLSSSPKKDSSEELDDIYENSKVKGQKAQHKRERNQKANGAKNASSQLKVNEAARTVICQVCRNTFLCTIRAKAKRLEECFPGFVETQKN